MADGGGSQELSSSLVRVNTVSLRLHSTASAVAYLCQIRSSQIQNIQRSGPLGLLLRSTNGNLTRCMCSSSQRMHDKSHPRLR